jgi:hypothetical protein
MKFGTCKFMDKHIARAILYKKDVTIRAYPGKGICAVYQIYKSGFIANVYFKALLVDICKENGFYSGSPLFPILSPSNDDATSSYMYQKDLWDQSTEYGQRRFLVYEEIDKRLHEYAQL